MGKSRVVAEKHFAPHTTLMSASLLALEQSERAKVEEDRLQYSLMSMVMSAFTVEAYFNYLGKRVDKENWEEKERYGLKKKLESLAQIASLQVDFSTKPFSTFDDIVEFRNTLAHAKPETVKKDELQELGIRDIPVVEAKWEKLCNPIDARRFYEDTEAIIEQLHSKSQVEGNAFPLSVTNWTAT